MKGFLLYGLPPFIVLFGAVVGLNAGLKWLDRNHVRPPCELVERYDVPAPRGCAM